VDAGFIFQQLRAKLSAQMVFAASGDLFYH
jgi:hypothetical protein